MDDCFHNWQTKNYLVIKQKMRTSEANNNNKKPRQPKAKDEEKKVLNQHVQWW